MLTNDKIVLRAVEPSDVDYLFEVENNMGLWRVSNTLIPFSRNVLSKYANSVHDIVRQGQFRFIIETVRDKKMVGMIDLYDFDAINRRAGVGVVIQNVQDRRDGWATEALSLLLDYSIKVLHLKQLYCSIQESNRGSMALFAKLGFTQVGIRKEWYYCGGSVWEDEYLFQKVLM